MTDPNFLFSLPPFIEQKDGINYVVLHASGGDDSPLFQAAADRLEALGGGVMRVSAGDFSLDNPFYVAEGSIRFG